MDERKDYLISLAQLALNWGFIPVPVKMELKRPYLPRWQDTLTQDAMRRIIREVNKKNGADGIGILTGRKSNIVVLDIDDIEAWNQLERERKGFIPATFSVVTPSGGIHLYFHYDERIASLRNSNHIWGLKIDFRTDGGVILFAGNISEGKGAYEVYYPEDINERIKDGEPIPLASMPDWIYEWIKHWQTRK